MSFLTKSETTGELEPISYANSLRGEEVFLCGAGPSLKTTNCALIERSEKYIMGINNSFEYIHPDIWIGVDDSQAFDDKIWTLDCLKIYDYQKRDDVVKQKPIQDYNNIHFIYLVGNHKEEGQTKDYNFSGDFINFYFEGNTFTTALHILYWMGTKRVYLIGCDFGGESFLSKKSKGYNEKGQQKSFKNAIDFLKLSKMQSGVEYISCTPDSSINDFLEYKSVEEVLNG